MNILMVGDSHTQLAGGSLFSMLRFADLLKDAGHKVVFIAERLPGGPGIDTYNGMRVYHFRSLLLPGMHNRYRLALPSRREIEEVIRKEKVEIVHLIMPTPAANAAANAASRLGVPVVAHLHSQPEIVYPGLSRIVKRLIPLRVLREPFYRYLLWVYRKVSVVICPTRFAQKGLERQSRKVRTAIISNGVPFTVFRKRDPAPFLRKYGLHGPRLLFVGRFDPWKSVGTLVGAMPTILEGCPDAHLDLVGVGQGRSKLERLAERLGVASHVTFFGKLPLDDLVLAYNACSAFVLPSFAELEGMVVLEAMACGKPIIISDSTENASAQFVHGNGFLFRYGDPKNLAEKAVRILTDGKLRAQMGAASFRKSRLYDIRRSLTKLIEVYRKAKRGVAGARRPSASGGARRSAPRRRQSA